MTIQAFKRRFGELLAQAEEVEKTKSKNTNDDIDGELFIGWLVKARNLLSRACGEESEHYRSFKKIEEERLILFPNYKRMLLLKAVLLAAKEDFEGGYLRSICSLVHAELFDDELEQATELLTSGYKVAAAVVARVVLETTLRKLCGENGLSVGKLDKMNADLAKAGVYNLLIQKRVTALADIGNKAAHGDAAGFREADVSDMIAQVERFITDYPIA